MSETDDLKKIDDLKKMAAPNSERIAVASEKLVKEQAIANKLLGKICKYKEEQKQGDIKFRKNSTKVSLFSVCIALTALYISIVGLDGDMARLVMGLFDVARGLL